MQQPANPTAAAIYNHAFPLSSAEILGRIHKDAEWVLIGEASHGTKEFYETRASITKDLIEKEGFNTVAVEADFPDAFRANLWVRGLSDDRTADEALSDFKRFPTWMWRNKTVVAFLDWLHGRNTRLPQEEQRLKSVGFYGLDVYSLNTSTQTVISYLERIDPEAAKIAKQRYSCFDRFGADAMLYGLALRQGYKSCEVGAIKELVDMRRLLERREKKSHGQLAEEEWDFAALENARVVKDAEQYYRAMFFRDDVTWNIRDRHMVDSAESLRDNLKKRGIKQPKIVIWAHNSHLGDARATDMGRARGEVNIGQLMRERFAADNPENVINIGFTTHTGTVAAADDWDQPVKHKRVNPSMADSYEGLMHSVGKAAFGLDFLHAEGPKPGLREMLHGPRLERAIGVIYRPDTERWSHYFKAWLPLQFDMILHIDATSGVEPLEPGDEWEEHEEVRREPPETYPFAL